MTTYRSRADFPYVECLICKGLHQAEAIDVSVTGGVTEYLPGIIRCPYADADAAALSQVMAANGVVVQGSVLAACCGATITLHSIDSPEGACSCGKLTARVQGDTIVCYRPSGLVDHHP